MNKKIFRSKTSGHFSVAAEDISAVTAPPSEDGTNLKCSLTLKNGKELDALLSIEEYSVLLDMWEAAR